MSVYRFRLAALCDKPAIVAFMNTHWGSKHPLVNLPDYFTYYYQDGDETRNRLNFALCLGEDDAICALCGFIKSCENGEHIWISIWCADKKAKGAGLELMSKMPQLTGAKLLSCNNIRPNTIPFYEFLGYTGARMRHWYRLGEQREYKVASPRCTDRLAVFGDGYLARFETAGQMEAAFCPPEFAKPYKDHWYLSRRYFAYPRQSYLVYGGYLDGICRLLFCLRRVEVAGRTVLRLCDVVGRTALLPQFGAALDALIADENAEYLDCYCYGAADESMTGAGFTERTQDDETIIPHYLTPPLYENVEFYLFTSDPAGFVMFRADGDQDRPNISV